MQQWLDYQLGVHLQGIDLGLARVGEVWQRLGAPRPAPLVVTVAGTNGKGSTVAFLEAMLAAGGYRTGAYTSPHILAYNERVRVDRTDVDDAPLIAAFARIDAARGDIPLTYFEFGTLAALLVFADAALDVAILEVGLGGRLDAVNLIDADVAIVTTIALDHQDWLGSDRDSIGREKAGVARAGRPLVVAEADPPDGLLAAAAVNGARVIRAGVDYSIGTQADGWHWADDSVRLTLPAPALPAACQPANAAAAIAALRALGARLALPPYAFARGVAEARVRARLQRTRVGDGELVIDVAHNPQAAGVLAEWLAREPAAETVAVFGALTDKDVAGMLQPLRDRVAEWHLVDLSTESERGRDLLSLDTDFGAALGPLRRSCWGDVASALDTLAPRLRAGTRVVAFGSFYIAAAALRWLQNVALR
ncbi:MAG TPA: bifunctional tetrahydrofolate synthase/dihydrofolate synthase [Tahibacter sp.]|uniref:bifunctional tetrahydrofolate synthase/dihydrofolate synthase n=1 Tax=Tahibacter sp. TaxID=2056211 RepID=UPI002BB94301|nr:bifunctional tetrahydrofolate synthase/dihydrofolate synthase [Tahibacter sp.]HSX60971.1 bifunctional tetrahydrofolate synthase/dihydrofolate synthase [Tahibacter sp.]